MRSTRNKHDKTIGEQEKGLESRQREEENKWTKYTGG